MRGIGSVRCGGAGEGGPAGLAAPCPAGAMRRSRFRHGRFAFKPERDVKRLIRTGRGGGGLGQRAGRDLGRERVQCIAEASKLRPEQQHQQRDDTSVSGDAHQELFKRVFQRERKSLTEVESGGEGVRHGSQNAVSSTDCQIESYENFCTGVWSCRAARKPCGRSGSISSATTRSHDQREKSWNGNRDVLIGISAVTDRTGA